MNIGIGLECIYLFHLLVLRHDERVQAQIGAYVHEREIEPEGEQEIRKIPAVMRRRTKPERLVTPVLRELDPVHGKQPVANRHSQHYTGQNVLELGRGVVDQAGQQKQHVIYKARHS